jgi:hypothetical protein
MEQWSSIAEAGRRIHKEFNRDEAQGENFYDRNFALLRAGFAACLAFHALACVVRTGEGSGHLVLIVPRKLTKKKSSLDFAER